MNVQMFLTKNRQEICCFEYMIHVANDFIGSFGVKVGG